MRFWLKFGLIIAAIVLTLFFAFLALVLSSPLAGDGYVNLGGISIATWLIAILGAFFIIAVILAMIISAITWGQWLGDFKEPAERRSRSDNEGTRRALETLDQRYARGEIQREEYFRMRDDILRAGPKH